MSEDTSWVKMHRSIIDHWVFQDPMHLKVWFYLLATANFKPSKALVGGRLVTIGRGEVLTSLAKISEVCGCSIRTVRTIIDHLETDTMIDRKTTRGATHLSIVNYGRYQDKRHASDTPNDTQNDIQTTRERHANDNIIRREEGKEGKEEERREEGKAPRSLSVVFKPPTIEDVQTMFRIRGLPDSEAELFHSYYESQGWVKANGQPVRNWQQLIPSWATKYHKDKHNDAKRNKGERVGYDRSDAVDYLTEVAGQFGLARGNAGGMGGVDRQADGKALPSPNDAH